MGGIQVLIFGTDELYDELSPLYREAEKNGIIDITAFGIMEDGKLSFYKSYDKHRGIEPISVANVLFHAAILSAKNNYFPYRKQLIRMGVPENRIIDGRVFKVPGLQFPSLLETGIAPGMISPPVSQDFTCLRDLSCTIHPRHYFHPQHRFFVKLGIKSYITYALFDGRGRVYINNYASIAHDVIFELNINNGHDYNRVFTYDVNDIDSPYPFDSDTVPEKDCIIDIGSDVWIGRGSILKSASPDHPLTIGDGAVIAADSVVVKDVPPYAIVGGNPAQIIKYRFPREIIDSLLQIKWWDWPLEKIHENLPYFGNPADFVRRFS